MTGSRKDSSYYLAGRCNRRAAGIGADRLPSRKGTVDRRWASLVARRPGINSPNFSLVYLEIQFFVIKKGKKETMDNCDGVVFNCIADGPPTYKWGRADTAPLRRASLPVGTSAIQGT